MNCFYQKKLCLLFIILLATSIFFGCASGTSDNIKVPVIFDAPSVSRISAATLVEKFGDPESTETWKSETSKGTFDMLIYCYSKDGNYYEFFIADDSVVRMNIYSENEWYNKGNDFTYFKKNKSDTLEMFGITPTSDVEIATDNEMAYRLRNVSDQVSDFWIPILDASNKTFGSVKITFDANYFE